MLYPKEYDRVNYTEWVIPPLLIFEYQYFSSYAKWNASHTHSQCTRVPDIDETNWIDDILWCLSAFYSFFFLDFRIRTCKSEKNKVTKQEIDESWNYIG